MSNAWPLPLFALPSDNIAPSATASWVVGTADAAYPPANVLDLDPAHPAKANETTATLRLTFGGNVTPVGVALINHNLAGATVTLSNNAGTPLSTGITIPANTPDGQCLNPWLDLSALGNRTASQWNIAVSGASLAVGIGEVWLVTALRDFNAIWGFEVKPTYLVTRHKTFGGTLLQHNKRVRMRRAMAQIDLDADRASLEQLHQECMGGIKPFLFIPDEAENDAWLATLMPESFATKFSSPEITHMPLSIEEVSSGPPLFP